MTSLAKLVTTIVITSPLTQEDIKEFEGLTDEQRSKGMEQLKREIEQTLLIDGETIARIELEIEKDAAI